MYQFYTMLFWHKKHLGSQLGAAQVVVRKSCYPPTGVQIPLSNMFALNELNFDYLYIIYS